MGRVYVRQSMQFKSVKYQVSSTRQAKQTVGRILRQMPTAPGKIGLRPAEATEGMPERTKKAAKGKRKATKPSPRRGQDQYW